MISHKDLFSEPSDFLYFAFDFSIFGNKNLVDKVEFCLYREFKILESVLKLCFEDSEVILNSSLFLFDFIFEVMDIFLLVLEQENEILREHFALVGIEIRQLGVRTTDRKPRLRNVGVACSWGPRVIVRLPVLVRRVR